MRARKMSAAGEMPVREHLRYLRVFNMHWHSRKVMRECWPASRIPIQNPWDFRTLRTCGHIGSRKPAVKQLSNSELLRIIRQDKEDATSTATAQNNSDDLDLQELDILQQRESLLAVHSPQLSQSPFIDRGLIAARIRRKAVKPLPSGDRSPFQLKLQKNPYAIALATPPRLCVLTGLRLPSYFQIPFGVATHPKTGAPWHLPKLPFQAVSDPSEDEMPSTTPEDSQPSLLKPDEASTTLKSPTRTLSSTNFVASRQVLAHVSGLAPSKYKRLIPYRWREDPSVKLPDLVWREDMDVFILDILRKYVAKTLSYLASRPAAYIAPCKSYDGINNHDQVAAVLWLRKDGNVSNQNEPTNGASTFDVPETGPPPYDMHFYKNRYIPCYNLAALLGLNQLSVLQESRPDHYSDQFAVIKLKRNTVKVQLELWKLLGYIVQDGKYG